jgi:signal transduction histidine kinase/ActR/RegA family two-component response regulator
MKWSIGTRIAAGFGVALLILVVTDLVAYRITTRLIQAGNQEAHSLKILQDLGDTFSLVRAAETGQRGYVITGDAAYLEPYMTAIKTVRDELAELRQLEAGRPDKLQKLDALGGLIDSKLAELQETILLRKTAGFEAATRVIQTHRGKKYMDGIEQIIDQMTKEEEATFARRDQAAEADARAAERAIMYGSLFSLLILAGVSFSTTRGITRPVRRLVEGVEKIGSGVFAHRVAITTKDEIGGLATAFNHMAERLQRHTEERNRVEEALHHARRDADRANRAKSEFLSRMSHELRTPLNAILGFAQLLEMESLTPEQHESVGHVLKGGRHLLDLINEVLDIARIESGRLTISLEPVRVSEVLQEALALIRPLAAEGNVQLESNAADNSDRHILADRQRLKQVLLNLLANAVKYNRKGGKVVLSHEQTPAGRVRIQVVDTGWGIPPEKLARIFTPFERLGAEQTAVEGTGLGLVLSKRLVEAMGGALGVDSAVGRGSTFWLEFSLVEGPVERQERDATYTPGPAGPGASSKARVVLYIEDNLPNLELVQRLFAHHPDAKILPAMQGRLGLDLARKHRPELILLDLHLPDISGDMVFRQLQQDPETRNIPVVIISADATPGQRDRLMGAGVRGYLTKPLDVKQFLSIIDEVLQEPKPGHVGAGAQQPPRRNPL